MDKVSCDTMVSNMRRCGYFSCDQAALWTLLSVTPLSQCSSHCTIMNFSGVTTIDKSGANAKGQGQRSKVKVTEATKFVPQFPDCYSSLNSQMALNFAVALKSTLLFLGVIHQMSRSHEKWAILTQVELFRAVAPIWINTCLEGEPFYISSSFVKFQGHRGPNIDDLTPISAFPCDNSSLNSWMVMKWHIIFRSIPCINIWRINSVTHDVGDLLGIGKGKWSRTNR